MILWRIMQVAGIAGILACGMLAWQATPFGGDGWSRARLLYAGAGAIPALALLGIAAVGQELRRVRAALARIEQKLGD